jgi:hypothetical protein
MKQLQRIVAGNSGWKIDFAYPWGVFGSVMNPNGHQIAF